MFRGASVARVNKTRSLHTRNLSTIIKNCKFAFGSSKSSSSSAGEPISSATHEYRETIVWTVELMGKRFVIPTWNFIRTNLELTESSGGWKDTLTVTPPLIRKKTTENPFHSNK